MRSRLSSEEFHVACLCELSILMETGNSIYYSVEEIIGNSRFLSGVSRVDLVLNQAVDDGVVERIDLSHMNDPETDFRYRLNLKGFSQIDDWFEDGTAQAILGASDDALKEDDSPSGGSAGQPSININQANANRDQIVQIFNQCKVTLGDVELANDDRVDAFGRIDAAISLTETANPLWDVILQIAEWLKKFAEIGEYILKILHLMGVV